MPYEIHISHAMRAVAEGSITVGATAQGIPADQLDKVRGGETEVTLSVETDQIRISYLAGGAPATSHRYNVDDSIRVAGSATCRDMRMIQVTGSATVRYTVWSRSI